MSDIILIDQFINQEDGENNRENCFYVRLSVDKTSDVDFVFFKPLRLIVEERMGSGLISCRVLLDDIPGSIVNVKPLESDYRFTLYIGRSPESVVSYDLKLYKFSFENMSPGESSNYSVSMHLISSYWKEMILKRESKGWKNTKHSDIISEIADDCGIENVLVGETKETKKFVGRPYWTNHQLIKWIAPRSISKNDDTFFVFSALPNNSFFFCSFSELLDEPIPALLRLDGDDSDPRAFILSGDRLNPGNDDDRLKLRDFKIDSDYVDTLKKGASGVRHGYYDFENRSYVTGESFYSESNEKQLSDWAYLSEEHENSGTMMFGGRDVDMEGISKSHLSRKVNQLQKVTASMNGITDIQVGEKIDVLIPVSPEFLDIIFNEFYSGAYIITMKRTILELDHNNASTVFNFSRQGINGSVVNTLVTSSTGKVD